jgi:hypothetical protein
MVRVFTKILNFPWFYQSLNKMILMMLAQALALEKNVDLVVSELQSGPDFSPVVHRDTRSPVAQEPISLAVSSWFQDFEISRF